MKKFAVFSKNFGKSVLEVIWEDLIPKKKDLVFYKNSFIKMVRKFLRSEEARFGWKVDKKIFKFVLTPIFIGLLIFAFVRPSLASLLNREEDLAQYLASGENVLVAIDVVDGYSLGFFEYGGEKTYVSPKGENTLQIKSGGEYVTYSREINGQGQVFLHHIPTDKTLQLTHNGTNVNPIVSRQGTVVWEGWIDGGWQLFVYDGKRAYQLTQGDLSIHADIEGDFIVFGRKSKELGIWRSVAYSLKDQKFADISVGEDSEYPRLEDGTIYYGPDVESQKRYPLNISDLFLLGLDMQTQGGDSGLTDIEKILKELEEVQMQNPESVSEAVEGAATDSAVMLGKPLPEGTEEINATSSASSPF